MGYKIDRQDKFTIIEVEIEKFNTQHAPDLKGKITELIEDGTVNLVIDLHGVHYIDSLGPEHAAARQPPDKRKARHHRHCPPHRTSVFD